MGVDNAFTCGSCRHDFSHVRITSRHGSSPRARNLTRVHIFHVISSHPKSRVQLKGAYIEASWTGARNFRYTVIELHENCSTAFSTSTRQVCSWRRSGSFCRRSAFRLPDDKRICVLRISGKGSQRFLFHTRKMGSHEWSRAHGLERQ